LNNGFRQTTEPTGGLFRNYGTGKSAKLKEVQKFAEVVKGLLYRVSAFLSSRLNWVLHSLPSKQV
jgi:hypothetical protein